MFEAKSNANLLDIPLPLDYHPNVLAALKKNKPVVGIETSYITHWKTVDRRSSSNKSVSNVIEPSSFSINLSKEVEDAV